jgi:hypothetical protein
MPTKKSIAIIGAALAVLVVPAVSSARADAQPQSARQANQLNAAALSGAYDSANNAGLHATSNVVSPDGHYLGADPDRAVRFELARDWVRGTR